MHLSCFLGGHLCLFIRSDLLVWVLLHSFSFSTWKFCLENLVISWICLGCRCPWLSHWRSYCTEVGTEVAYSWKYMSHVPHNIKQVLRKLGEMEELKALKAHVRQSCHGPTQWVQTVPKGQSQQAVPTAFMNPHTMHVQSAWHLKSLFLTRYTWLICAGWKHDFHTL